MLDNQDISAEVGAPLAGYIETLSMLERLHRLLLDVVKDEFERLGIIDINSVQALLLFNIGDNVVTAGELKTRGYYQGSNVSYNLKKLVETGYMHHERCEADRRAVRVRLTDKGQAIRTQLITLFARHTTDLTERHGIAPEQFTQFTTDMRALERFWTEQIRFIY